MDFGAVLLCHLLIYALTCGLGTSILHLSMLIEKPEEVLCFTLNNETLHAEEVPKLGLILQVAYPQAVAEAGEVIIDLLDLPIGSHTLYYKHISTNMTHDLRVRLDGMEKSFTKSRDPRWFSVSTFLEVLVLSQGNISVLPCPAELRLKYIASTAKPLPTTELKDDDKAFFIKDSKESETFALTKLTSSQPRIQNQEIALNSSVDNLNPPRKVTTSSNSGSRLDANSMLLPPLRDEATPPSSIASISPNKTNPVSNPSNPFEPESERSESNTSDPESGRSETNTSDPESGRSETNTSDPESGRSQICPSGDCGGAVAEHDYTLGFVLFGILGLIALIAVVISVVFHRKKKKLIAVARAKPKNRLRQQIYDNAVAEGEEGTGLKLNEMENVYEEIP